MGKQAGAESSTQSERGHQRDGLIRQSLRTELPFIRDPSIPPSIHAWAGQVRHSSKRQPCPRGPWSRKSKSRCFGLTTFLSNGPAMLHRQEDEDEDEDEDDLVPSAPISTAPPRPFRWRRWRGKRRNQFPLVTRRPIIRELQPSSHPASCQY